MLDCPPRRAIASRPTTRPAQTAGNNKHFQGGFTWIDALSLLAALPLPPRLAFVRHLPRTLIRPTPSHSSIRFRPAAPLTWSAAPSPLLLEPILKQPCMIETKAGAAGALGGQVAANAKPDGYTMLIHIVVDLGLRRSRQAVRPPAQVHARGLHPDRAADVRPDGSAGQRPAAIQERERARRRCQEPIPTS